MAISAKPTSYSVNTGATHCPDRLYMMDEGSGTTLVNKGKTAGYNLTFGATTGAGPDWIADGTHTMVLDFILANEDYAEATVSGLSGVQTIGIITKPTAGTANRTAAGLFDNTQIDRYAIMNWRSDEFYQVGSRFDDTQSNSATNGSATGDWDFWVLRCSDTALDWSLNGSAFATNVVARTGMIAAMNTFALGRKSVSTPSAWYDDPICAAMWWHGSKSDADISAIYNSGDLWTQLGVTSGGAHKLVGKFGGKLRGKI